MVAEIAIFQQLPRCKHQCETANGKNKERESSAECGGSEEPVFPERLFVSRAKLVLSDAEGQNPLQMNPLGVMDAICQILQSDAPQRHKSKCKNDSEKTDDVSLKGLERIRSLRRELATIAARKHPALDSADKAG